jgi:acetylglutamate kinase
VAPNVDTLIEALPYIREFRGETFVVRCEAGLSEEQRDALCRDIAMLRFVGVKTVLVHPAEVDGAGDERRRDNHRLVHGIGAFGNATGLSGGDGAPRWLLSISDDGALSANVDLVEHVIDDYTPVIEAVAVGPDGDARAADADLAAARLAIALGAYKLLLVVGSDRVRIVDGERQGTVSEMRASEDVLTKLAAPAPLAGALQAGRLAVENAVTFAHLLPSDVPHSLLLELFTNAGYGTKIRSRESWSSAGRDGVGYETWEQVAA